MNSLELGLIGNCGFCALIDEQAEVVWCCLPRFESALFPGASPEEAC